MESPRDELTTPAVVVGASAAGLATSACLRRAGVEHVLLEKSDRVASSWRAHYERLHLHTHKGASALPFLPFPDDTPRYPSRQQVVDYQERYVRELGLEPRFGEAVSAVSPAAGGWLVESARARYRAHHVVIATGFTRVPAIPAWPGVETYRGDVLHSAAYKNGEPWRGRRVLVIGFGNSAGEIVLDLHEHGALPTLAVRGAVNVISKEILGLPILSVAALLRPLPPRLADFLGAPLQRLTVGNIEALGLRKLPYGPMEQVMRDGRIPLIDIGTLAAIRAGHVAVRRGVDRFTPSGVRFEDGVEEPFDAVVAATGYRPGLDEMVRAPGRIGPDGLPATSASPGEGGLHFCGFLVSSRGMLNEIGFQARAIAQAIARAP